MKKRITYQDRQAGKRSVIPEARKLILLFLSVVLFNTQSNAQGSWTVLAHTAPHHNNGVMLLLTNGTVLCKTSSGGTGYGMKWDKLTPDIHGSYVNGTWTTIASMANERLYFSTQVLPDGRVYVAGGEYGDGGTRGEVYNPITNVWTPTPRLVTINAISDANSEILPNGKVLQALVDTGNTKLNYLWDPATNTYSQTGSCLRRDNEGAWVKLPDNSVLFLDNYSTTSERYIPATNTWINDATAPVELYDPYGSEAGGAFLLPNGKLWFIGSTPTSAYYTPSGSTAPGTWVTGPVIPGMQGAPDAASSIMPNGKILMAVSPTPTAADNFPDSTTFYVFDYNTNTYALVGAPGVVGDTIQESAFVTNMLSLPDGTILFANQGDNRYYEFVPDTGPLAAGQPTIDSTIRISCDTFMATGKLFNGITEGASYGDDWQMSTNYPIIRLTSGTNVYYATTYHWNRIGAVMTGTLEDTTTFVLPAGLPAGAYTLQVVVNGNPSASVPFNNSFAISPSPTTLCQGYTSTLTDVWPGGTWSSAATSIATIDVNTGLLTGVTPGTTTINYTKGGCSATSTVTVSTAPAAITPAGIVNVCMNATTALSDANTGGAWSSSATGTATVNASGIVSGITTGTATISYTIGSCAAVSSVTVNPLPVATITPSGTIKSCTGANVALSANTGTGLTYQWQMNGGTLPGATNAGYTSTSPAYYSVIVKNATCQATSLQDTVVISTGSVMPVMGTTTVCTGQTAPLSDATASGTWSSSNTALATVSPSGVVHGIASGTVGISYTVASLCDTLTAIKTMTVILSAPVSPITGTANACIGASASLNDVTASGTWSSSNAAIATVTATGSVTGLTAGSAVISYIIAAGTGCSTGTAATVPFIVNAPPPTAISPTGPDTICSPGSLPLNAPTGTGFTYQWENGISIIPGATSAVYVATAPGNYSTVIVNSITGCMATSAQVAVNTATSIVPFVSISSSVGSVFCAGATPAIYTATPVNGGSIPLYEWYVNGVATAMANPFIHAPVNGDVITCRLTSSAECAVPDSASASITMTVSTGVYPAVSISASPDDTVCAGDTVRLSAVPVYGGTAPTYIWSKNGSTAGTGPYYSYTPHNNDLLAVTMTSNYSCLAASVAVSNTFTMYVDVPITNNLSVSASDVSIIAGHADTFTALAPNAGTAPVYKWFVNGVQVPGANSSVYITSTLANGDVVTCAVTSSNICADPPTVVSGGITVSVAEGIGNINKHGGLTLLPNPNSGTFTISGILSTASDDNVSIIITDMLGQAVYKTTTLQQGGNVNAHIVLPASLANGMYLVNVTSGADHTVFHMVIDK